MGRIYILTNQSNEIILQKCCIYVLNEYIFSLGYMRLYISRKAYYTLILCFTEYNKDNFVTLYK